jgi:hypothetical protein
VFVFRLLYGQKQSVLLLKSLLCILPGKKLASVVGISSFALAPLKT